MSANEETYRIPTTRVPQSAALLEGELSPERRDELARAAGYREGYAQATQEAAQALERAAQRLDEAGDAAREEIAKMVVELSMEVAKSMLAVEIDEGRYDIEKIVREALSWSGVGRGACTVHLNPEDLARIQGIPFRSGTEFEADAEVARGDVHVTTPRGLLVRELDEAIESVHDRLLEDLQ